VCHINTKSLQDDDEVLRVMLAGHAANVGGSSRLDVDGGEDVDRGIGVLLDGVLRELQKPDVPARFGWKNLDTGERSGVLKPGEVFD
jgi:hypothetical protein